MNKYLLISAAALLASAGTADAVTVTFSGYCGSIILTPQSNRYNAQFIGCSGQLTGTGFGIAEKIKGFGKFVDLSDNALGNNYGIYSEYLSYLLSLPLKNGGSWSLWIGINGISSFEGNSGTYNVDGQRHGGRSIAAETRALVEKLKSAKAASR